MVLMFDGVKVFHLYKGFYRKSSKTGYFFKSSVRATKLPRVEYKGFKFKSNKRGHVVRGMIVNSAYMIKKKTGITFSVNFNTSVLIKKKNLLKSKYIYGFIPKESGKKRLMSLFVNFI